MDTSLSEAHGTLLPYDVEYVGSSVSQDYLQNKLTNQYYIKN